MPLELSDYDIALIPMGMLMMFPSLTKFVSKSHGWARVERLVKTLEQIGRLEVLTVALMRCLDNGKESAENEALPVSPHLFLGLVRERGWVYPFIELTSRLFPQEHWAQFFCTPLSSTLEAV